MAIAKGRTSHGSETKTLKVGDTAPDFELKSHAGETFKLSDQRGALRAGFLSHARRSA